MSVLIVSSDAAKVTTEATNVSSLALAEAKRQGFGDPAELRWATGVAWWFDTPGNPRSSGACIHEGELFAASFGALQWRGLRGDAGLRELLSRGMAPQVLPLDEVCGSYAIFMANASGVWLFGDALGLQKIYAVAGGALRSTSMMICRAAMKQPRVDRLRAQEYILLGANHSAQTPLEGLTVQGPTLVLDLLEGRSSGLHAPQRLLIGRTAASAADAVAGVSAAIVKDFTHMAQAWGPNIGMALSGGFDSRLLLAALDHVGVSPSLYVYGRPLDEDVVIARAVAHIVGLSIECIDKSVMERGLPALTAQAVRDNLVFFYGLPVDGVFDRGSDRATRLLQVPSGRLNLNGAGGEILRNFFYLRDQPFSAVDSVAAFCSGWLDEVFMTGEDRVAYVQGLQDSVLECLGRDFGSGAPRAQPLRRSEVELVYALFRLRYWMGRNNTVLARYGAFMTTLVIPSLVTLAAPLPLAWKDYGRPEAEVIRHLSPRVASGPSAYGFDFAQGPNWKHRLGVAVTMYRPVVLRHQSLRVKRAVRRVRTPQVPAEWCDATGDEPRADWLNPGAICQLDQLNRLMTLQASDKGCGLV
jgi:hypothetical protein